MSNIFFRHISFLLHLVAFTVVGSVPALAEIPAPFPGTTATEANSLTAVENPNSKMAQVNVIPGRPTRGGSSYVGIGGNIGLGGESGLSQLNFVALSKIGLTRNIAVRPALVFWEDTTVLVPVTFDFPLGPVDAFDDIVPVAPYIGGGIAIDTSNDGDVGALVSGGVDVSLTPRFTATAAVNVAFLDETDVGLLVGIGYNFRGLGL